MESYRIVIKKSAAKEIEKIQQKDKIRIIEKIRSLAIDPQPVGSKKLSGQEKYRVRLGNYRILYQIIDEELLKDSPSNTVVESVIATYRNLRENYERRFRHEEANKFLARELEIKKIYDKNNSTPTISDSELINNKLNDLKRSYYDLKMKIDNLEKKFTNEK